MSEPFIAEIRIFGFDFAPPGWAFCDGQLLSINQNQSLFSLLGTTYGGDGETSFGLPDLRGRTPLHRGTGFPQGTRAGEEGVSISESQMPSHTHGARATSASADSTDATGRLLGVTDDLRFSITPYANLDTPQPMISTALATAGLGQGHNNMQPFLALRFCIALVGTFPSM